MLILIAFAGICLGWLAGLLFATAKGLMGTCRSPAQVKSKCDGTLRVVTLNLAHGRGLAPNQALVNSDVLSDNVNKTAHYLDSLDADIVGLQEVDKDCNWSGNLSQARSIAREAGFSHYRMGINNERSGRYQLIYGNAILSRFPIVRFENHPFSDWKVGGKGFLIADLDMGDRLLSVVVVHLAPVGNWIRKRQVRQLVGTLAGRNHPLIVLGDFNSEAGVGTPVEELCQSLKLKTVNTGAGAEDTFRFLRGKRIDFIFASEEIEFSNYYVSEAMLSDHRPVVGDVSVKCDTEGSQMQERSTVLHA